MMVEHPTIAGLFFIAGSILVMWTLFVISVGTLWYLISQHWEESQ